MSKATELATHLNKSIYYKDMEAADLLRQQDEAIKLALVAFDAIVWSNDSEWQADCAKEALEKLREVQG